MNRKYTPEELEKLHIELYDILGEIIRVCNKNNIPYFAIGGTAIGLLYDKAILPWDDDIDIGMTRENYNRFLEIAPKELGSEYFLSWIGTDEHTPFYFAKVKKNNTLFVEDMFKNVPMHKGIFVDILPLDRIPDNKTLEKIQHLAAEFFFCCLLGKEIWLWKHFGECEIEHPTNRGVIPCMLTKIVDTLFSKRTIFNMLLKVQTFFNNSSTRYYNNVMTTTDHIGIEASTDLKEIKFGPLMLKATADLEGFLRYNFPTLHRFTKEEQEKVSNHCPDILSFNTKQ